MRNLFLLWWICLLIVPSTQADPDDLEGGVLIAHHPPELEYTSGQDWCQRYTDDFSIHSPDSVNHRIDIDGEDAGSVWFVLAAWDESKQFCGAQFGFGWFPEEIFSFSEYGPCFPNQGLQIPTGNWPGPNEGVSVVVTNSDNWSGNFVPVYYFAGYAYSEGLIPLSINLENNFGGTGNCSAPSIEYDAIGFGCLGLFTDGFTVSSNGIDQNPQYSIPGFHIEREFENTTECEFPLSVTIAEGNELILTFDGSDDSDSTSFLPGESVIVDVIDDVVYVGGHIYYPRPETVHIPDYDFLRYTYGGEPFVLEHLSDDSDASWLDAVNTYNNYKQSLRNAARWKYTLAIDNGLSESNAADVAADFLREYPLIFSSVEVVPDGNRKALLLRFIGEHNIGEGWHLLYIEDPRSLFAERDRGSHLRNRFEVACGNYQLIKRCSNPVYSKIRRVYLSYGGITVKGTAR